MNDSEMINQNFRDYVSLLTDLDFQVVLEIPFKCNSPILPDEKYFVFFSQKDGLLITCETCHSGTMLHDGKIYFSHPNTDSPSPNNWAHGSNNFHHTTKNICIGSNDARHKIVRLVNELRKCYTLMPKWVNQGGFGICFLHYRDTEDKNYDYRKINNERWNMLPPYVREAIPNFV